MSLARGATAPLAGAAGGPPLPAGAPLTAPPLAGPPRVTPPLAAAPRGGIPLPLEPRTLGYCRDDLQQGSNSNELRATAGTVISLEGHFSVRVEQKKKRTTSLEIFVDVIFILNIV